MTRTAAAENLKHEEVFLLPVDECHKSPSQPRKRGGEAVDEEFVASIKKKVQQPIVVRVRKAGGWEIVFGHRRHKACVVGEVPTIPAIVRDMTDEEVFEAQLVENIHRQDMHPLDEADSFQRMVKVYGRTAQQVAEKVRRPLSYVAQRLKLVDLGKEGRAALEKDKISLGVAMIVARIPSSLQAEAMKNLWDGIEYREAKRQIESRFLLQLSHAPFKLDDAKLVEKAGACSACPKRTGQQRELFPDAGKADMCVDPVCYRVKLDAVWQIRKRDAAAGGAAVLEGAAAKKAMDWNGGYKKLDDEVWAGRDHKKVRAIFGKDLPPITLARDDRSGAIFELVREADIKKKIPRERETQSYSQQQRQQQERDRLRAAAVGTAIDRAIAAMGKLGPGGLVRLLTRALVARTWDDSEKKILSRRGIEKTRAQGTRSALEAYLRGLKKPSDIAGLGLELALWTFAPGRWGGSGREREWGETMRATGVNFTAIEKKLKVEAAAKKRAKKKPKKK